MPSKSEADGEGADEPVDDISSALTTLYRGEIDRVTTWRGRLDQTTNWTVTIIAVVGLTCPALAAVAAWPRGRQATGEMYERDREGDWKP